MPKSKKKLSKIFSLKFFTILAAFLIIIGLILVMLQLPLSEIPANLWRLINPPQETMEADSNADTSSPLNVCISSNSHFENLVNTQEIKIPNYTAQIIIYEDNLPTDCHIIITSKIKALDQSFQINTLAKIKDFIITDRESSLAKNIKADNLNLLWQNNPIYLTEETSYWSSEENELPVILNKSNIKKKTAKNYLVVSYQYLLDHPLSSRVIAINGQTLLDKNPSSYLLEHNVYLLNKKDLDNKTLLLLFDYFQGQFGLDQFNPDQLFSIVMGGKTAMGAKADFNKSNLALPSPAAYLTKDTGISLLPNANALTSRCSQRANSSIWCGSHQSLNKFTNYFSTLWQVSRHSFDYDYNDFLATLKLYDSKNIEFSGADYNGKHQTVNLANNYIFKGVNIENKTTICYKPRRNLPAGLNCYTSAKSILNSIKDTNKSYILGIYSDSVLSSSFIKTLNQKPISIIYLVEPNQSKSRYVQNLTKQNWKTTIVRPQQMYVITQEIKKLPPHSLIKLWFYNNQIFYYQESE